MLKTLFGILVIVAVVVAGHFPSVWQKAVPPCTEPITYSIGTFDRRFDISHAEFLQAISLAEAIWEKPISKELFAYSPENGELKINLVYDYRQQITEELNEIEGELKQDETTYRAMEREYLALKSELSRLESIYEAHAREFETHNAQYEQMVSDWNSSSRTSRAEFERLEEKRNELQAELARLKVEEARLNGIVRQINSLVPQLNRLARELNLNVEEYNTIGAARGETFAGGIYSSSVEGEKIDIYEFSSKDKLVRILAHELGHALGLEHIEDKDAIMYKLNQGDKAELSQGDIAELKKLCAISQ